MPIDERIVCEIDNADVADPLESRCENICVNCQKDSAFCSSCGEIVPNTSVNQCTQCKTGILCEACKKLANTAMCLKCIAEKMRLLKNERYTIHIRNFKGKNAVQAHEDLPDDLDFDLDLSDP
jgi:hypothetical protein